MPPFAEKCGNVIIIKSHATCANKEQTNNATMKQLATMAGEWRTPNEAEYTASYCQVTQDGRTSINQLP